MLQILQHVPLHDKTTLRIGGRARWYIEPATSEEAIAAVRWAREQGVQVFALGRGSNVLVSDSGWPGLALNCAAGLDGLRWEGNLVTCGAGALLHTLARQAVERGLAGIEKLAGIPGTVAGAVVMNAGAFGQDISRLVARVDYVGLADGCAKTVGNADMRFGYRTSALKGRAVVITEVAFCFVPGEQGVLEEAARASLASRRSKHPLDLPNCGSVFKNPRDSSGSAGGLIEAAGLKGFRVGDIEVSEKHANFFVNKGHATAEDFRRLVRYVQERVYLESAVYLEPEVVFVGAFAEQLYETATHAA